MNMPKNFPRTCRNNMPTKALVKYASFSTCLCFFALGDRI